MVAPANSRGHLFWYWRRFGAVWAGAGFVRAGPGPLWHGLGQSSFARPAWASAALAWFGPAQRCFSAVLGLAGGGDVLALAPFAFQDAHQDSVKVAAHVVDHFAAASFSYKPYGFI